MCLSKIRPLYFSLILLAFCGCKSDVKDTVSVRLYFDLKGFMRSDSAHLVAQNPWVDKTVSHNDQSETRKVKIVNWGHELSLISSSDINKPSWRGSYIKTLAGDSTIYIAKEPDLKTQRLVIIQYGEKVKSIHILNHIKNPLFEAIENLFYYPDSAYVIDKKQHVLLLGSNHYLIKGKLEK